MVNLQLVRDDTLRAATGVVYKSLYMALVGAYRRAHTVSIANAPRVSNTWRVA
jgi:hypothetical protein